MRSARMLFESLYGDLPKATFIYDDAMAPVWQNAAADAFETPDAIIEAEGRQALRQMRGMAVSKGDVLYSLIPQETEGGLYLAVQAERDHRQEKQATMQVLRNASAKLNGYLNRIYGTAQQIGLDSPAGAQLGKEVQHILRMSNHLYQLLDRSGIKDYVVPLHVGSYLEEFARAVAELKPEFRIKIEAVEPELYLQAMPENLDLMLAAMVSNAYRFGNGTVVFRAQREGEMVCIEVLDDGEGVADVERLFEWGYRTADKKGALGLGFSLATALKLAQLQGGTMEYQRLDGLTCFKLLLPLATVPIGTRMAEWVSEPMENSLSQLRIELSDIL
ncbi:MAG: HAMP domain-containing histidine kinase [Clostridia bacterium]|nr:HAMP domain-containing histidine kinase [Clostridia bacterium]